MEDFDFVQDIPEEYLCSICLCLLCDPHLTTCCGHHFCKDCIFKVAQANESCPMCKTVGFVAVVDKNIQRKIRALSARCRFYEKGCRWEGELRSLMEHLDLGRGQCKFNEISCPKGCGTRVLCPDVELHLLNACPNRDKECQFCNKIVPFSYMARHHQDECQNTPVPCPNGCSESVLRHSLHNHHHGCPMRLVECNFSPFGCSAKFPWCRTAKHMEEWSQKHLSMIATCCSRLQKDLAKKDAQLIQQEKVIKKLKEEVSLQQNSFTKTLLQQKKDFQEKIEETCRSQLDPAHFNLEEIKHRVMILETQVPVPPYYFTVSNFALHKQGGTHWTCPAFFSRIGGYKMAIEVSANGEGVGKDTHVSVYIRIMRGEYDDMLRWPLRASVTIQLISQSGNEATHYEMTTPQYEWVQVRNGVVGVGWGWDKFIHRGELEYNSVRRTEYLKNDRLNFRVICVD